MMDDFMLASITRITACLEACEGIETTDLKPGLVKTLLTPPKRVRKRKGQTLAQAAE
jgi:hypothetical protein